VVLIDHDDVGARPRLGGGAGIGACRQALGGDRLHEPGPGVDVDIGRRDEASRRQRESWLSEAIDDELTGPERRVLEAAIPLLRRLAER